MSHRKPGRSNARAKNLRIKHARASRAAAERGTTLVAMRTSPIDGRSAYEYADGSRTVELPEHAAAELREYKQWAQEEFERRWGRPMTGEDLLFQDWDAAEPNTPVSPVSMEATMVAAMEAADWPAEFIYAYQHTGRLVTQENAHLLNPDDIAEWNDAIDRWRRIHG